MQTFINKKICHSSLIWADRQAVNLAAIKQDIRCVKSTIKDVAKLAGVSFKTVSRVINKEPSVRQDTIDKVNQAIAQLNYQPNSAARNLAGTKTYAIGYVYDNPNAYYVINMQNGILNECRTRGYELLIHPCHATIFMPV